MFAPFIILFTSIVSISFLRFDKDGFIIGKINMKLHSNDLSTWVEAYGQKCVIY